MNLESKRQSILKASIYKGIIYFLGVLSLVTVTVNYPPCLNTAFIIFLFFAAVTSFYRIRLSHGSEVTLSYVVVFSALLYLGPAEACWVAAFNGIFSLLFKVKERTLQRIFFNACTLTITAAAAASAYTIFGWNQWPFSPGKSFLPACAAASVYLFVNAGLIAGILFTLQRDSFVAGFKRIFVPLLPATFTGMTFAIILTVLAVQYGIYALFAPCPLLLLVHISTNALITTQHRVLVR